MAASSAQEQHRLPAAGGIQNLMAMAIGSFRREELGYTDKEEHIPAQYSSKRRSPHDAQVVRTKGGSPGTAADKRGTRLPNIYPDLPPNTDLTAPPSHHHYHPEVPPPDYRQPPPPTSIVGFRKNANSMSNGNLCEGQSVTSEITMLNFDFLEDDQTTTDDDDQTIQTNNTNDNLYTGMDQMQAAMNDMLNLAKSSNNKLGSSKSFQSSGSLHSLGNISFGVSSVFNHRERLYGGKEKHVMQHEQQQQVGMMTMNGDKMEDNGESSPWNKASPPLPGLKNEVDPVPPTLRLSPSQNRPDSHHHRQKTFVTSNTTTSKCIGNHEEYSDQDIDAIIALKLEVANQRELIDELSSKLNRALGEKKELEEQLITTTRTTTTRRRSAIGNDQRGLNQEQQLQQQQQSSSTEESNLLSSSLRQLRVSTSTLFSSFSAHSIRGGEVQRKPSLSTVQSSSQQTSMKTLSSQQQSSTSTPISTSWSREKSGSATAFLSTPPSQQQQQQQQQQNKPSQLEPTRNNNCNNNNDKNKLQLQVLDLQSALVSQIESTKRKEREWMSQLNELQVENERLYHENIQFKNGQIGSSGCGLDSSHCSSAGSRSQSRSSSGRWGGLVGGGSDSSKRSLMSDSDGSSRSSRGRIADGMTKGAKNRQSSISEGNEEEEEEEEEEKCESTQSSTGVVGEDKGKPIFVRTKEI